MERKENNSRKKYKKVLLLLLFIIVASLLFVTVTYTVGSTILNVVGIQNTQIVSWDIRLENLKVSKVGDAKFRDGSVSLTSINNFRVMFNRPGDEVVFNFDVVNKGNLDAKLDYFSFDNLNCYYRDGTSALEFCKNIYYNIEYDDGSPIRLGDSLNSGQKRKVRAVLKYSENSLPPVDIVNINNLNISLIYGQK